MKELVFIKVPSALLSTILPIYLLSIGFSTYEIGIFNSIMVLSAMLSSFYFSFKALEEKDVKSVLAFSSLSMFISTISLAFLTDFESIFLSLFIFSFYYNAYLYFLKVFYSRFGNVKEVQSKFEFYGGIFYLIGLIIGIFLSAFLDLRQIIIFASFWFFIGIFYAGFRKMKLLELFEEISCEISKDIIESLKSLKSFKISKRTLLFHIGTFLFVLVKALYSSQFQVYLKRIGFTNNKIFLTFFLGSFASAIFYRIARRFDFKFLPLFIFIDIFPLLLYTMGNSFLIIAGFFIDGATYGLQTVLLDSFLIERHQEEFGTSMLLRNIAGIVGSYLCGLLLKFFSFKSIFLFSSLSLIPVSILMIPR